MLRPRVLRGRPNTQRGEPEQLKGLTRRVGSTRQLPRWPRLQPTARCERTTNSTADVKCRHGAATIRPERQRTAEPTRGYCREFAYAPHAIAQEQEEP